MTAFVEVQHLVGRAVRDREGRVIGRIESILAAIVGPKCVVDEFHLGTAAFLARIGFDTATLFGFTPNPHLLRVPWKLLNLSDPKCPRVGCTAEELRALQSTLPPLEDDIGPPERLGGSD